MQQTQGSPERDIDGLGPAEFDASVGGAKQVVSTSISEAQPSITPYPLTAELGFYSAYAWCLNAYPPVKDSIQNLRQEIERLQLDLSGWQINEVALNVFLLSLRPAERR